MPMVDASRPWPNRVNPLRRCPPDDGGHHGGGVAGHTRGVDADAVRETLALDPHPEGGHYRETWADEACTAIYYLLEAGDRSAWHRIRDRVEIWHFYAGAPLQLSVDLEGPGTAATRQIDLGTGLSAGQRPQAIVPAGAWQSACSLGAWTLVGCTVTPPFTFEAFDLASE